MHPRDIAKELDVSHSSVHRIIKTKVIKQFEGLKTPYMNNAIGTGRVERAIVLTQKFEKNLRMNEHAVFQDESDFPSQILINRMIVLTLRVKRKIFLIKIILIKQIDNVFKGS